MSREKFQYRVLIVDDEESIRYTLNAILHGAGYIVVTAEDGFDALRRMQDALPELIISDLRMPNMSGFEFLSVVRRRFPNIGVIAVSGEYSGDDLPRGVLADAFLQKGAYSPDDLLVKIKTLLEDYPLRPLIKQPRAPLWVPKRNERYVVITCTDCLRSFPLEIRGGTAGEPQESKCVYCDSRLEYVIDEAAAQRMNLKAEKFRT